MKGQDTSAMTGRWSLISRVCTEEYALHSTWELDGTSQSTDLPPNSTRSHHAGTRLFSKAFDLITYLYVGGNCCVNAISDELSSETSMRSIIGGMCSRRHMANWSRVKRSRDRPSSTMRTTRSESIDTSGRKLKSPPKISTSTSVASLVLSGSPLSESLRPEIRSYSHRII